MVSSRTGYPTEVETNGLSVRERTEDVVTSPDGDERVSRTVIKPRTGFRAELPGLDIATLIQMTCARRDRLVVRVASYGDEGFIYSADGRIVHATLGELVGEEAVLGMMAWSGGEFAIVDLPFPLQPSIESSTEILLLRAAQRSDEAARLSNTAPAPTSAVEPSAITSTSPVPAAPRAGIPPPVPRASIPPPAPRASATPSLPRSSLPPPAPRASSAVATARISAPPAQGGVSMPPAPGRISAPPSAMPPSAYARVSQAAAARDSIVPAVRNVPPQGGSTRAPQRSIQNALRQSYDDDDVPTLLPPSPRTDGAPTVAAARARSEQPRAWPGEAVHSEAPRGSKVPPPLPQAARSHAECVPMNDSALIASVRVDARGAVVGTFADEGTGDLLPQLVAYVARLIALLRADFSLDPFEALHAELSGMRIMLFEDAGETVGLMMRPGSAVQELRQRLGV